MFNFNIIEAQINKRLLTFFQHKATEENLDPAKMQLIICSQNMTVAANLYADGGYIRKLELKSIAESFGKEFDHDKVKDVHDYLVITSKAYNIVLSNLKVMICMNEGKVGAFVYDDSKFICRIKSIDLLNLFYFSKSK
jgi:hypothetical protein